MKLTFIPLNQNKSVFHINSLICEGQKGVMYIAIYLPIFAFWSFLDILPISNKSQKCEQNQTIFRGQAQFSDLLLSALTMISFSLPGRLKVIKLIFFFSDCILDAHRCWIWLAMSHLWTTLPSSIQTDFDYIFTCWIFLSARSFAYAITLCSLSYYVKCGRVYALKTCYCILPFPT